MLDLLCAAIFHCPVQNIMRLKLAAFNQCIPSLDVLVEIVSSVRSSSVYHGLLHTQQATFSNFSNSSDSKGKVKVKGPNMCYIFEKHGIQGYQI